MKIFTLKEIEILLKKNKSKKKIGLCHGVFDILHEGHIEHFQESKKFCDILVVTVTSNSYVNKGPNRPINNHFSRAKMLSSLKYIDYVAINYNPTSENVIKSLKPNIYFKGKDYLGNTDHTNRLNSEMKALKNVKAKLLITKSDLKSSSKLINKNYTIFDNTKIQNYLSNQKREYLLKTSLESLSKIKNKKVLIIGDIIFDQYSYVKVMNKPIKESILAAKFIKTETYSGGVLAAANNLKGFCNNITVLSACGDDNFSKSIINKNKKNFKNQIFFQKNTTTVTKRRFVDVGYNRKMHEVYYMKNEFLDEKTEKKIVNFLNKKCSTFDSVILLDYGHGLVTNKIGKILQKKSKFLSINCQTNSANLGYNYITKYKKANYVCIDEPEIRLAISDNISSIEKLIKKLSKKIKCGIITITLGKKGSISYINGRSVKVPALITEKVIDTIGAGDVFLVITSMLNSINTNSIVTNLVGNACGAQKVDIIGHKTNIDVSQVISSIKHLLK